METSEEAPTCASGSYDHGEGRRQYTITADYKKSTYEVEAWSNTGLIAGKTVLAQATIFYRWGEFLISLNDAEKEALLAEDEHIVLSGYEGVEMRELWDSQSCEVEIDEEETYSTEELKLIRKSLKYPQEEWEAYDRRKKRDGSENDEKSRNTKLQSHDNCHDEDACESSDSDLEHDPDTLEENGWNFYELTYGFHTGCIIERYTEESQDQEETKPKTVHKGASDSSSADESEAEDEHDPRALPNSGDATIAGKRIAHEHGQEQD